MSRHGPNRDRVTVARLAGAATRHARDQLAPGVAFDEAAAVHELVDVATERIRGVRPRLRVDLLSDAAGGLLGSHRHNPTRSWSEVAAAHLLMLAGADKRLVEERAATTLQRLTATTGRAGIGNR